VTEETLFLLDTMKWSFSRLNSFYQCNYEWKLHYIECNKSLEGFFGQFGSFMHKILEMYAKEEISLFELSQYYEDNFSSEVTCDAPPNGYVDIKESYYNKGMEYLDNIDLILDNYEILGVEKEVKFKIGNYDMIGYIDLLLKDKETGKIIILDHKSASIKILKSGKISKSDQQHFLEFQRQLYLYSKAVIEEYGHADYLEWNMFKDRNHIKIEWTQEGYDEAIKWAEDTIHLIENEENWFPNPDYYYCNYLCGQRENACEYKPQPVKKNTDSNSGYYNPETESFE